AVLLAPMYLAVPVQDSKVVDAFLERLDLTLARHVPAWRQSVTDGVELRADFTHLTLKQGLKARALAVRMGPVQWRCYWARLGDGLYLANQPGVLEDLQEAQLERYRRKDG